MKKKTIGCLSLFLTALVIFGILVVAGRIMLGIPASYDIRGTITDTDGNPLNDVNLDKGYDVWGAMLPFIRSRQKVDSEFRIRGSNSQVLELKFSKKGYYPESCSFKIGSFPFKKTIQIRMKPSEQMGVSDILVFHYREKQKYICDLSDLDHGIVQVQTVDLETNPETKHLEIDFKRDENGTVVYSGQSFSPYPVPEAIVVRLHSDDPNDGLIASPGSNVSKTRAEDVGSRINGFSEQDKETAEEIIDPWIVPETGYNKKEIVLESPSESWWSKSGIEIVFFLKCGDHFGKGEFSTSWSVHSTLGFHKEEADLKFELDINKEKGDRQLRQALRDEYIPQIYW